MDNIIRLNECVRIVLHKHETRVNENWQTVKLTQPVYSCSIVTDTHLYSGLGLTKREALRHAIAEYRWLECSDPEKSYPAYLTWQELREKERIAIAIRRGEK